MYLYVIIDSNQQHCKIGFSKNPEKRLKTLQTGNSSKLILIHTVEVPVTRVKDFETQIHNELRVYQTKGEWFKVTPDFAKNMLDWLIIRYEDDPFVGG